MKPKTTVYIPCHDYGRFLREAVDSVLIQSRDDWELFIVADGASDDTEDIAQSYAAAHRDRVTVIHNESARGLRACANEVLRQARGDYVMRLDADDYLDENALLVLSHYLDTHAEVALVYGNYTYVDEQGEHLGVESRKKIGDEARLLDLPAHGACTLVRKRVLKNVGGYDESFDCQDGYELWLKVLGRYPVANITTTVFYYRQHGSSLTRDEGRVLAARAGIKRAHVLRHAGAVRPTVLVVVGAKNTYEDRPNIALSEIAGRPLLDYTLDAALQTESVDLVLVSTDDLHVVDHVESRYPRIRSRVRPPNLSSDRTLENGVVFDAVQHIETTGLYPDIVVSLSVHTPLRTPEHIRKVLDTLLVYNVDSVISVCEDAELHYVHGTYGLEAFNPGIHRQIRVEREGLYVDTGAIRAFWRDTLTESGMLGQRVGHVVTSRWESLGIKSEEDAWLVERVLESRVRRSNLTPNAWARKA